MTVWRLFAIALILFAAAVGWVVLGGSVTYRTETQDTELAGDVGGLWGDAQHQTAPSFRPRGAGAGAVELSGSDVEVDLDLEQRKKGLLWYATYQMDYSGAYRVTNTTDRALSVDARMSFPDPGGVYDGFGMKMDGRPLDVDYRDDWAGADFTLNPGQTATITTGYRTQGLDSWSYSMSQDSISAVRDFSMTVRTDFEDIDFPPNGTSPTRKTRAGDGWKLTWDYDSLVSGRPIGLVLPKPSNPGPLAARIAFFAPVSLVFYFAALVLTISTRPGLRVHPMNFAFLAAGFFAFHLLFAYLVDRIDVLAAFAAASGVSVALCVGYLSLVLGRDPLLLEAAISQTVFLVLFSYTFFHEGYTGLAITIGAIITLAYFMAKTGQVDWGAVFARPPRQAPAAHEGSPPAQA